MKILLGTISLSSLGGTETWTKTIYDELSKEHDVSVYSPKEYRAFPELNVANKDDEYDVAFINHKTTFKKLKKYKIKKRIVVIHGVIPKEEKPAKGADQYFAVSEEIAEKYKELNPVIVRNPIDLNFYKSTIAPNKVIKKVLFASNYKGTAFKIVVNAFKGMDVDIRRVGGRGNQTFLMKEAYNWADLVIGLGRTAYEAMACERNVIIFDYNGGDGFVTPENLLEFRKNNCSGRREKIFYSPMGLLYEAKRYNSSRGRILRDFIKTHNSSSLIAKQLLEYAK